MKLDSELLTRWPIVAVAFLGVGLGMPVLPIYGWGLFMGGVSRDFGWSFAQVSSGFAAFTISMAVAGPIVGYAIDRWGAYRTVLVSLPITCIAMACLAWVDGSMSRYYALWICIGLCGLGSSPIVWTRLISQQFTMARGKALGIASTGGAAFLLLIKPIIQAVIDAAGWRAGIVVMGLLPLVTLYPVAVWLLRSIQVRDAQTNVRRYAAAGFTTSEALTQWRFAIMVVASICMAALAGLLPHLESLAVHHGASASSAAATTSIMGVTVLVGRLLAGYLSDKLWAPGLFAGFLALGAVSACGLALGGDSPAVLFVCIIAVGLTAGGEFELLAYVTSRYFGVRSYAAIFGVLYGLTIGLGGPWSVAIGRAADVTGDYSLPLQGVAVALVIGAALLCAMSRPPHWREGAEQAGLMDRSSPKLREPARAIAGE
jgi:MFS family permease